MGALLEGKISEPIYRSFFALLLLNLIGLLSEFGMGIMLLAGMTPTGLAIRACDFISYLSGLLQCLAFFLYLKEYLERYVRLPRAYFILALLLVLLSLLLLIPAQLLGLYGGFVEGLRYVSGALSTAFYLSSALSPLLFLFIALRYRRGLKTREWLSLLSYPLIMLVCYVLEGSLDGIWVSYLGVSIIFFVMYINLQGELKQQLLRKDAELAEQRISIMLSQIQPHFLYNALNTIGDLCATDPEQAQETVFDFADYLRMNMDSLTISGLVPFDEELRHVKTYLALEQRRFGDRLRVEYDIQARSFSLPPLTVQPIVENAVLHGITVRQSGGRVLIRTRDSGEGVSITVSDDGVGFSPAPEGGRTHLGIENVRHRLEAICGGSLSIESAEGKDTVATIFIPHKRG